MNWLEILVSKLIILAAFGRALGVALRGENTALLAPLFLVPAVLAMTNSKTHFSMIGFNAVFGGFFWWTNLECLANSHEGALTGLLLFAVVLLTTMHVVFCAIGRWVFRKIGYWSKIILPFALVVYEYSLHNVVKLYDGVGLTYFQMGQGYADHPVLLQFASFGGLPLLTFFVGLQTSFLIELVSSNWNGVKAFLCAVYVGFLVAVAFQIFPASSLAQPDQSKVVGTLIILPDRITHRTLPWLDEVLTSLYLNRQEREGHLGWVCVVGPETALEWRISEEDSRGQYDDHRPSISMAILDLSKKHSCFFAMGAWVLHPDGCSRTNAVVTVKDAQCVFTGKRNLCWFEKKQLGMNLLVSFGVVSPDLFTFSSPLLEAEQNLALAVNPVKPLVCNDLFFPATYSRNNPALTNSVFVCCSDSSFDEAKIFENVALLHSRLRAVEFGNPIARCAIAGSNFVLDARGNQIQKTDGEGSIQVFELKANHFSRHWLSDVSWDPEWLSKFACIFFFGATLIGLLRRGSWRRNCNAMVAS